MDMPLTLRNRWHRAGGFNPLAQLFGAGEVGFVGEVLPQYLWQDTARTTPVTADGDPVASWALRGAAGSVIYATQATAGNRPIYKTAGGLHWLEFDGAVSNRWLVTPTITPGTDKAQIFAGVRKLSDAAVGILAELGTNSETVNGSIGLAVPGSSTRFIAISRGTVIQTASTVAAEYNAPTTRVATVISDIAGDRLTLRLDGTQAGTSASDQGLNNYAAGAVYIGRRGGTSNPFNGRLYSLIVRFGPNLDAARIVQIERWVNSRTGAY
jgi:hypothetical protein